MQWCRGTLFVCFLHFSINCYCCHNFIVPAGLLHTKSWLCPISPSLLSSLQQRRSDLCFGGCFLGASWLIELLFLGFFLIAVDRNPIKSNCTMLFNKMQLQLLVPVFCHMKLFLSSSVILCTLLCQLSIDTSKPQIA